MIYLIAGTLRPEHQDAVQACFKQTGGFPPEGVRMPGRWHGKGTERGVCAAETDDSLALAQRAQQWADLLSLDIFPALNDQGIAETIP